METKERGDGIYEESITASDHLLPFIGLFHKGTDLAAVIIEQTGR